MAIDGNDYEKTALITHDGLYEWRRMPFGLVNCPAIFQRALHVILAKYKWHTCLVYIDDVVIFSNTVEDHIYRVDEVLTTMGQAGISLNFEKRDFFTDSITYLGHIVKPGRLEIDALHTKSLR